LGKWVIGQRHNRQKGQLSEERKEKLDSIGFIWSKKAMTDSQLWEFRFQQLVEYKSQHGDCNVPTQNDQNPQLGSWVGTQRAFRKNGRLSKERQDKLDAIGFDWKANRNKLKHTDWNLRFEQLCDFQKLLDIATFLASSIPILNWDCGWGPNSRSRNKID
jgi:hypothetical protein